MNDDLGNIHYSPIQDYQYEHWFREVQYNGKELNDDERKEFLKKVDECISQHIDGLPLTKDILERIKDLHDDFHEIQRTIVSVSQFCLITMIDSMVLGKYFILANKDYYRRLMRGKLRVVLNEGFKKLYGFEEKTRTRSEWNKVSTIINYFPEELVLQYEQLSSLLDHHAQTSSWWRDERNMETHLDTEKLYVSRCEEVVEAQVMLDSLKLFDALFAVNLFLSNLHSYLRNVLLDKYLRGELREE
jgi:hypothetical protein